MRRLDGQRQVLHLVKIVSGGAEDDRRLLVIRERVGKAQRAVDRMLLDLEHSRARRQLEVLAMREDRGIACGGRLLVRLVVVSGALILDGRAPEVFVLEQQVRQLVIDRRRLLVGRERIQELCVPTQRLAEVRGLLLGQQFFLVQRVIVAGEIGQVLLEKADDFRRVRGIEEIPVLRVDGIA